MVAGRRGARLQNGGGLPQNQSRIGWWIQIFRITVFQKALEMVALRLSDPDRAAKNP